MSVMKSMINDVLLRIIYLVGGWWIPITRTTLVSKLTVHKDFIARTSTPWPRYL